MFRESPDHWLPPVDVYDTPGAWLVFVEIPGVSMQEIDLSVTGDRMVVRGVKRSPANGHIAEKLEIRTGAFKREIMLPGRVDASSITARMSNGVLMVRIPHVQMASVSIPVSDDGDDAPCEEG